MHIYFIIYLKQLKNNKKMRSPNDSLKQALISNKHYQKIYSQYQQLKLTQSKPLIEAPQIYPNQDYSCENSNDKNYKYSHIHINNSNYSQHNSPPSSESNGYQHGCNNRAYWENCGSVWRPGGMQFGCFDVSGLRVKGREPTFSPESQNHGDLHKDACNQQPDPYCQQSNQ